MRTDLTAAGGRHAHALPAARRRVRLVGIDEQPAWVDPTLATFFQQLRALLGWPPDVVARQLGTLPEVIVHLEAGRLRALPPWPETERILVAYGRLVALDLGPAAQRIRQQTIAGDPTVEEAPMALVSAPGRVAPPANGTAGAAIARWPASRAAAMPPPAAEAVATERPGRAGAGRGLLAAIGAGADATAVEKHAPARGADRTRSAALRARLVPRISPRGRRGLVAVLLAAAAAGAAYLLADSAVEAAKRTLPARLAAPVTAWLTPARESSSADGLLWIDVADPRSRKADKLRSTPER